MYARSVSAAGESDPIVSDPGSCDVELRVVRRVVRVIDSVTSHSSGPESGPTGHCQNSYLHVTQQPLYGPLGKKKLQNIEIDETETLGKICAQYTEYRTLQYCNAKASTCVNLKPSSFGEFFFFHFIITLFIISPISWFLKFQQQTGVRWLLERKCGFNMFALWGRLGTLILYVYWWVFNVQRSSTDS